jgi:hypothetical protein
MRVLCFDPISCWVHVAANDIVDAESFATITQLVRVYPKQGLGPLFQKVVVESARLAVKLSANRDGRLDRAWWWSDRRLLCVVRTHADRLGSLLREGPRWEKLAGN